MRRLFLAVLGMVAVAGVASAQQPQYQPVQYPTAPSAAAAAPISPASGTTVIKGNGGCSNCGPTVASTSRGFTMSKVTGGNCVTGNHCQSGCGSLKSDLAFHFGSCKSFFAPCGPTLGSHFGGKCGTVPFATPWGQGFSCPRAYDSYANH